MKTLAAISLLLLSLFAIPSVQADGIQIWSSGGSFGYYSGPRHHHGWGGNNWSYGYPQDCRWTNSCGGGYYYYPQPQPRIYVQPQLPTYYYDGDGAQYYYDSWGNVQYTGRYLQPQRPCVDPDFDRDCH